MALMACDKLSLNPTAHENPLALNRDYCFQSLSMRVIKSCLHSICEDLCIAVNKILLLQHHCCKYLIFNEMTKFNIYTVKSLSLFRFMFIE